MSCAVKAPVYAPVIAKARTNARRTVEEAAQKASVKPETILMWESGEAQPTLPQLRNLASLYDVNVATLLATTPDIFDRTIPTPSFRRDHTQPIGPDLLREIHRAQERRRIFLELGAEVMQLPEIPGLTREQTAHKLRHIMGISTQDQIGFKNEYAALKAWISSVESMGILVFHTSKIPETEFLGLSIREEKAPIIILNGSDTPQRRIFTLMHELGHLVKKTNGVCDREDEVTISDSEESWCNKLAAGILLPKDALLQALGSSQPLDSLSLLSHRFTVSQSVVAICLHELGKISDADLRKHLSLARDMASKTHHDTRKSGGPPYEVVKLRNLGIPYIALILQAVDEGKISLLDASYFLDVKIPIIEKMRPELTSRIINIER